MAHAYDEPYDWERESLDASEPPLAPDEIEEHEHELRIGFVQREMGLSANEQRRGRRLPPPPEDAEVIQLTVKCQFCGARFMPQTWDDQVRPCPNCKAWRPW